MKKTVVLIPEYIKKFKCIGSECEDTCCADWRITVDEKTYKKYKKVQNYEMRQRLQKHIGKNRTGTSEHEFAKIRLESRFCPFLQENKLCEIHGMLGEEYLCNTCAVYPRINSKVNETIEQALTLSCPEAARVILLNQNPIQFEQEEKEFSIKGPTKIIKTNPQLFSWKDYFWEMRIFTIGLLQNRNYSIEERLFILGLVYKNLDKLIAEQQIEHIPIVLQKYKGNIDSLLYKDILKEIPSNIHIQLQFCKELLDIRFSMGVATKNYSECMFEVLEGLEFKEGSTIEQNVSAYKEGYEQYYKTFMVEFEYILENYLVNYVFANLMPIDQNTLFESFVRLILHYSLVKLHLIGEANYHKGLTQETVVRTIQLLGRAFEHNPQYFNRILALIEENNYMDLAHMAILIKN